MDFDTRHHRPATTSLAEAQVLHRLSAEARERLVRAGHALRLDPGRNLYQAGDTGDAVYVVLEGEVEILARNPEGVDVRIAALGRGAIVGEMSVLEGGVRSTDVVAVRQCSLYRIPRRALIEVLRSDPDAALEMIIELSRRLRATNATLEATMRLGLAGRLARLLLESANHNGLVALTQTEIAHRLAVSREQVNRELSKWAVAAIVVISPTGIHVASVPRLREAMLASKHH